jgi:hypothetical protein
MAMNRPDYYRAVLLGIVVGMGFLSMFYVFFGTGDTTKTPPQPTSNFEVVDKYKDCDLLRWSDRGLAEYKYVLYCPGK